jgi:hypothetical protein
MPVPAESDSAVPVLLLPARLDPAAWLIAPPVESASAEAVLATLAPAISAMPSALLKLIDVPAVMVPARVRLPVGLPAAGPAMARPPDRDDRAPTVRPAPSSSAKLPSAVKPVSVLIMLPAVLVSVALPAPAVRPAALESASPLSEPARMAPLAVSAMLPLATSSVTSPW